MTELKYQSNAVVNALHEGVLQGRVQVLEEMIANIKGGPPVGDQFTAGLLLVLESKLSQVKADYKGYIEANY